MLRPGGHPSGPQQWYDKLAPRLAQAREQLRQVPLSKLELRSGCILEPEGTLRITFFWREYRVHPPDFIVRRVDTGEEVSSFVQAVILTYMATADGATPSGRWIAFHSLPDGMFYAQVFREHAENRLAQRLGESGLDGFRRACARLPGRPLGLGDAGYVFAVLPRIHLAAVYWQGDEDFPSRASVLFEDSAAHYMPTDGLAILGEQLVTSILRAAGA